MSGGPVKLLLIEDDPQVTELFGEMLAHSSAPHFQLQPVPTLSDGLKRLEAGDINLIVLDLTLPDSRGLGSLNQIRGQIPELPIVVLTGLRDEETALQALREGAQDYLLKGEVTRTALVRAIRYAIERKRGEEARSRLAAIVESSRDAIIGMSLEGLIVSWNPGAETVFGYAFEEVIGRPMAMLEPAEDSAAIAVFLARLRLDEHVKDFEAVRLRKGDQSFHVAASLSPIRNSFGKVIGASMIARDIEDRVRAQQEREDLLRQLQVTLAQVNTLRGLLPICGSCKKIRDDQGYWTQVEVYVKDRSQAEFTHGICPECAEQYRAGMNERI